MGLFSDKKIVSVASSLYNMAGPEEDRPDFLKGTMFASVMADAPSLGKSITDSYLNGPGLKQKSFFRYAARKDLAGLPTASISNSTSVDPDVVASHITVAAGQVAVVQKAVLNQGDPEPFFDRWVLANHPDRITEDWLGDTDPDTGLFSIQFPNGDFFSFTPADYDPEATYITGQYIIMVEDNDGPVVEGTPVTVTAQADLTGYDQMSSTPAFEVVSLVRSADVTVEYSDSTPTENYTEDASEDANADRTVEVYEKTSVISSTGFEIEGLREIYTYTASDVAVAGYSDTQVTVEDVDGVTVTTTRVVTGEQLQAQWTEKYDTQQLLDGSVVEESVFIYEVGTGQADLDALAETVDTSNFQEFFPFLPLRIKNKPLDHQNFIDNGLYAETKAAYRRATDLKSIDKVLGQLEDNENIDDIDFAYIMYGVSLNVQEHACRKYIYRFFQELLPYQNATGSTISDLQSRIASYNAAVQALETWENTDWENVDDRWVDRPPRPSIPRVSEPEYSSIRLKTESELMRSFDIRLTWVEITDQVLAGKFTYNGDGTPRDAKKGEIELSVGPEINWIERLGEPKERDGGQIIKREKERTLKSFYIRWQTDDNNYREMQVWGANHENVIYKGKSVEINSTKALQDDEISGFVIPLHYPTMSNLGIVDYTQMATADVHILFNCYEVTKQKWWQSGFFKILLIVLVIVAVVIIFPGAFAAGGGVLGANVAVGAALGLTGTAAIVAGVVANYLASILISQLLSTVGTALFGEKWGAVFAAIASFAMGMAISGTSLFSAEGILGFGNALANGYAGWTQGNLAEMQEEMASDRKAYEKEMDKINDLLSKLGGNDLSFDQLSLTDTSYGNGSGSRSGGYMPETAEEFIRRTTMTGGDIVEMTFSMVYDFVDVQKTLPRN